MGTQRESALSLRIRKKLEERYAGSWWVKTSGNNRVGTPDLLGCVRGVFVCLEVKHPDNNQGLTRVQRVTLSQIHRAGGYAFEVRSVPQSIEAVEEALSLAGAAQAAAGSSGP